MEHELQLHYQPLRSEDVESIFLAIMNPRKTALRRTKQIIRLHVLRFFQDGINTYQDFYDNASIYYTSTAVEMGLLFKLRNEVKKQKEGNQRLRIDFNWLIENSNLDPNIEQLTHNVRLMRNSHVHYQNIIAYNAWQTNVHIPELLRRGVLRPEAASLLKRDKEDIPVRIQHLEENKEIKAFIQKRMEEHSNWLGSAVSRMYAFKNDSGNKDLLNTDELLSIYGYEAFNALTCIKWCFSILKALYIV